MELTMDRAGRLVVPKALRDALGLSDGGTVEVSLYGAGLQLVPAGPTAKLVEEDGHLVASSETIVDDEMIFSIVDSLRR
ncbi:MAG: AbrB/MazE/SpoVT family DNA-binding domain-containing protein [Rhodoglobus sp.]